MAREQQRDHEGTGGTRTDGPFGDLARTTIPTSRDGAHLFSMACRNSSKVRKGVPSPQMPRRLMYIMLRGSEAPRGWKQEAEASDSPHSGSHRG